MGMNVSPFEHYLRDVNEVYQSGRATEHSYRPAIINLLKSVLPDFHVTNEGRRRVYGMPDITVAKETLEYGYIETKDIGVELTKAEKSEQLNRYRDALGSFILTDYLEFRWFINGDKKRTVKLAEQVDGHIRLVQGGAEASRALLHSFAAQPAPAVGSAKELAVRMAYYAQQMRTALRRALREETRSVLADEGKEAPLTEQYESLKELLVHDMSRDGFVDIYAQTLCYGLFAARLQQDEEDTSMGEFDRVRHDYGQRIFTRFTPLAGIRGNPLLSRTFGYLGGSEVHPEVVWALDEVATILHHARMDSIKAELSRATGLGDPMLHFYETFLATYDKTAREMRGVYYTPEPVVNYMVRSVDELLKSRFNINDGLRDRTLLDDGSHKVQILDVATGTGTFLHSIIQYIYDGFSSNLGMWRSYAKQHLLPRLYGFELLIAPYTLAHLKLSYLLERTGIELNSGERLNVYLTNTLEKPQSYEGGLAFAKALYQEAQAATRVKQDARVMVIVGNPPYSGHSANTGDWIHQLLRGKDTLTGKATGNYFEVDGEDLGERNPKWLNDDYVKFIRFAQWRIEQTGYGVLAFISNHGYLDNPTFRGMRQSLMDTFDELYLLDLHGNTKKKERAPDGGEDKNVFDIQQGVAICFMVKHQQTESLFEKEPARVYHAHLWGPREVYTGKGKDKQLKGGKYHWLGEHSHSSTEWTPLKPDSPFYLFTPQDIEAREEYQQGWSITEIMPVNSVGIVTARDALTICWSPDEVWRVVNDFANLPVEEARSKYELGPDARDWKVELAQKDLKRSGPTQNKVVPILYRPFDIRHTYYTGVSRGFLCMPRGEVMRHMLYPNTGFILSRQTRDKWDAFATSALIGHKAVAAFDINSLFPLYLYPQDDAVLNPDGLEVGQRKANLAPKFVAEMAQSLGLSFVSGGTGDLQATFGPEDVLHYIYAILYSPSYRSRYAEFLKIDFPCIPVPDGLERFRSLCGFGQKLMALHLLKANVPSSVTFPAEGMNEVGKPSYAPPKDGLPGRVLINPTQYFEGIPPEVWNFYVGGYQVCDKWLKDRRGRILSYDDIEHYQKMVAAISETISLMAQIDEAAVLQEQRS